MPVRRTVLVVLLSCLVSLAAQKPSQLEADYDKRRRKTLIEATTRHIRLGEWARKAGLNQQAMVQFLLAEEISEGNHPMVITVVSTMRSYGDAFWLKHLKHISKRSLKRYDKRARDIVKRDRKDLFKLAKHAHNKKLGSRAQIAYDVLLRSVDGTPEFDEDGDLHISGGVIPAKYVKGHKDVSVTIGGRRQVRDRFLAKLPEITAYFEAISPELRVRSVVGQKHADRMHKMLTQLLPRLEAAVSGRPTRRLEVFVFAKRANFDLYLDRAGYGASGADGLTDPMSMVALICAEKRAPAVTQAIALHELAHLYQYAVGRVVFPSWYAEGFAETYGGQGTFSWQDDKLETEGLMSKYRLDALREADLIPIAELMTTNAMTLLSSQSDKAVLFYTQSWAFLRFLRQGAGEEVAEKLRLWEVKCRGKAIGSIRGGRGSEAPAVDLFDELLGDRLEELEKGFAAWLKLQ